MKRIAIIEDNRIIQQLLSSWFDEEEFAVLRLTDTESLAERIRSFNPDLVITDIMIPNETPESLIFKLRSINRPKVVLSSMDRSEVQNFADSIGAIASFCKHSDIKEMFDFISDHFSQINEKTSIELI
jgi:DNA-binding response OmpR family regulator